jgi:hypothetical protein
VKAPITPEDIVGAQPGPQRRAIAKAITLLESTRPDHRAQGDELLTAILPHSGKSFRLGISGVPGVGKSTRSRFVQDLLREALSPQDPVHLLQEARAAYGLPDPASAKVRTNKAADVKALVRKTVADKQGRAK